MLIWSLCAKASAFVPLNHGTKPYVLFQARNLDGFSIAAHANATEDFSCNSLQGIPDFTVGSFSFFLFRDFSFFSYSPPSKTPFSGQTTLFRARNQAESMLMELSSLVLVVSNFSLV